MTNAKKALRRKAEEIAKIKFAKKSEHHSSLHTQEADKLIHELQVHQIELDMQNDELRKAGEELEASHARYFELYDLAPVGYVTVTEKGLILQANLTAATLWGVDKCVLKNDPFTKYISRDSQDVYYMFRKKLLETKSPQTCELQMPKKNGPRFWAKLEGSFFLDSVTKEPASRIVISDINELKEQEIRYRSIFEGASDGIVYTNIKDHKIHYVNTAFLEMFGYSEKDIIGKEVTEIHPENSLDQVISEIKALKEEKKKLVENIPCAREDGTVFFADIALKQISFGNTIYNVGFFRDITLRKKAEEEKLSALKRSNKDLERFAHIASHDLKEPLRMISSYVELLSERYKDKIDSKADKYINYIIEGSTRMRAFIEDLLSYSCVKAHEYKFELVNVDQLIESVKSNLALLIEECNAEIRTTGFPDIIGDRIQIIQLFQNLISNAIKYRSPERRLVIEISVSKDKGNYIFSFKDNGIGIDSKYFNHIFIIFQRIHKQKDHTGSGIGLAVAKSIVDNHGGNIWVDSELNKGSTFYFTIPIKREHK
jgi:two-component system, chemotaxis family, sensor kinase Cph1